MQDTNPSNEGPNRDARNENVGGSEERPCPRQARPPTPLRGRGYVNPALPLGELLEHQQALTQWLSVCKRSHLAKRRSTRRIVLPCFFCLAWVFLCVQAALAAAPATNSVSRNDYSAFKIVNERNIFNARRSPRYVPSERQRPRTRSESFALVGTMKYEKGLFAFFDGSQSDYRKVLKQDDTIAGYKITSIEPTRVILASATNEVELSIGKQLRREEGADWKVSDRPEVIEPVVTSSRSLSDYNRSRETTTNADSNGDSNGFPAVDALFNRDALPFAPGGQGGPDGAPTNDAPPGTVGASGATGAGVQAPLPTGNDPESILERLRRRREQQENP
jgi:hypothetical protein